MIGIEAEPRSRRRRRRQSRRALREHPEISLVSFVHVEAASGVRNDAPAITALAREHGALVLIDVVASTGAHEVLLDDWGVDVAVIGPQKALAGPAGISIAAVSGRAWRAMSENPAAPRGSVLSLLDWKEQWLDSDKATIPGTPSPLEILALEAALERVRAEGMTSLQLRHRAVGSGESLRRAGSRARALRARPPTRPWSRRRSRRRSGPTPAPSSPAPVPVVLWPFRRASAGSPAAS